jgi:tRNA (uracil-5-)-methyltransferase TRM9
MKHIILKLKTFTKTMESSQDQKEVWDNIAPEWYKFKDEPGIMTLEFLKKQKGKILDLGCGSGRYLIKQKDTKLYLVDFSKEMLKFAKEKAEKINADAEFFLSESHKLPFDDNFFDSAICVAALHCIKEKTKRKKTIKELYRVLKPGSLAKISVWNKNSKRFRNSPKEIYVNWRDKGARYYYLYDPEELYKEVEEAGFKIIKKEEPLREIPIIIEKPDNLKTIKIKK